MYRDLIREQVATHGYIGMDPRHVEAYMRLAHDTLDGLSPEQFRQEVMIGIECVRTAGEGAAERCARSYGL